MYACTPHHYGLHVLSRPSKRACMACLIAPLTLSAAAEEQTKQLARTRSELGLKLHTVTTRSTEKEVTAFRNALELVGEAVPALVDLPGSSILEPGSVVVP